MKILSVMFALVLAACGEGTFRSTVTLALTEVNDQAIPVTLPSGSGTVQVLSGTIVGSRFSAGCQWTINMSGGTTRTGTIDACVLDSNFFVFSVDMGGPPAPSGSNTYQFGFN